MAFVPFTGKLDAPQEEQTPKFMPFTGKLDAPVQEGANFVPFSGKLDEPKEAKPAREYQDIAETPIVSPEESLTPPPPAKSKSIMEGFVPPATGDVRMELPDLSSQQRKVYDAATPAQRKELLKKDPAFKQIDEAYQLRDAQVQADTTKKSGLYKTAIDPYLFDTRAEHRKDALVKQGLDVELAETTARRMAYGGVESKRNPFGEITESPSEYEMAEGLKYDPRASGVEQTAQVLKRAGTKAFVGLGQAGGGMNRFMGDILGLDTSETVDRLESMERFSQAMGTPASKPVAIIEGAVNSIAQQLPALVGGVLTGSEGLVLASMFANSFGQNYDEGRRKDLDVGAATTRAAANAAFEVIGEKFGLKEQLAGIKAAASNVPTTEIINYFSKALVKEIPGEQLTYAGQFAVDKGFDMNPEAGIRAFIEGAVDTMASTVVQGGLMMGGGATVNKIVRSVAKEKPEVIQAIPSALELAKSKGFLSEKKQAEVRKEDKDIAQEAAANTAQTAQAAPLSDTGMLYADTVTRFQQQGFAPSDAARLAEEELKESGYGSDEIEAGKREFGLSMYSGAPPADGLAARTTETSTGRVEPTGIPTGGVGDRAEDVTDTLTGRVEPTLQTEAAKVEDTRTTPDLASTGLQPKGKKSTGRPKVILTPEQKAEKAAARKESQRTSIATSRSVDKLTQVLDEPFNPEDFPDEQLLKEAQETRDAEVIEALVGAIRIANDPKFRKNKATGQRAKALVDRFAPTDRIRQIAEARAKLGEPSKSLSTTTNEHDPDLMGFSDAQKLLGYIKGFGTAFERILADRLRPALKGVSVVHVADPARDILDDKARGSFDNALGLYFNKAIYLNANPNESGENNETALHEALHAGTVSIVEKYLTDPGSLTANQLRAMAQLDDIRNRAFEHYEKLVEQAEADPQFARANAKMLAKLYSLADPNGANVFGDLKEFISYGMTQPEFQEFLMQAPGSFDPKTNRITGLFTQFVNALRNLLNMGPEHMSALQDLIIVTDRLISPAQPEMNAGTPSLSRKAKKAKESDAKVDKDLQKVQASYDAFTVADSTGSMIRERGIGQYLPMLNSRFKDMGNDFIRKLLYGMQTVDILRWKGDEIPGLVDVDKIQQEMSAMKTSLLNASAKQADKLAAFVRKNGIKVISTTMHLARLKKVNPTEFATLAEAQQKDPVVVHYEKILTDQAYRAKYNLDATLTPQQIGLYKKKQDDRRANLKIVYDSWDALGKQKNGHEMYKMVRQFYKDNYLAMRTILDDQLNALPIDAAAKAKLLKSVRLMQEEAKGAPDPDYDGMTLKQLPEEYFPFKRHGDYWLRVTKGPTGREFYTFTSGADRNEFLRIRAAQLGKNPNDGGEFVAGDDLRSLREDFSTDSAMLQKMFAAIEDAQADGRFDPAKYKTEADAKAAFDRYREELKDQLYQVYLMTLPERSFRKQFLHSENVTGFSADVLLNFKKSATSYANQLAKLKYANSIRDQVQRARDSLEGMPPLERAKLELFVDAIQDIANDEIDPPPEGKAANRINQFAFVMLLTSGATAATQMVSIPAMVLPTLAERHGNFAASKEFLRFATFFKTTGVTKKQPNGDVEYTAPSIGSSSMVRNDPILQRAFQAALDRQVTTLTNTSVLTNRNRTPENAYESIPGVAARVSFNTMTALFNGAERMSREIAYMMAFKLEYAKTGNFEESVDKAVDTVHELLGRYDNFNRPRIYRNFVGKTVGQFKMYATFITSWFVRNGYTAFTEGMGNKEGRAAMQRLTGVLVMGGLFHGLVGQPLYSMICSVIDAVLDATEDEEEKRARLAKNPLTAGSSNLRFRYEFLPKYFGHIEITGLDGKKHRLSEILEKGPISVLSDINVGSRTSYDGIWFREAKPGKNWQETVENYVKENLGPGISTGLNMVGAIDDFNDGKLLRGAEKLTPAFFKAPLTSYRLATEGAETKGGAKILKQSEITDLNLIASALGFQSSRLARIQEHNFAMERQRVKAEDSKSDALRKLNETVFNAEKEPGDIKAAIAKIREHNKRYPMEAFLIDGDTIDRSIEGYGEKLGLTYRGLRMSEKLLPYLMPSARIAAPVPPKD
jgi:hypothetical protein